MASLGQSTGLTDFHLTILCCIDTANTANSANSPNKGVTPPTSMTEPEDGKVESNMSVVLAGCIGGFVTIIVSLVVCYIKRWCCFAVRLVYQSTMGDTSYSLVPF